LENFVPVKRNAGALLFDHPEGGFLHALIGGEAAATFDALTATSYGESIRRRAGIDDSVIVLFAVGTTHGKY
jgi:hypothetical protein